MRICPDILHAKYYEFMKKNSDDNGLSRSYMKYFFTGTYDRRYPFPNRNTLDLVLKHARISENILDYGCGNGRYTIPLLKVISSTADLYDPCSVALEQLNERSIESGLNNRINLINFNKVFSGKKKYDLIICLFGVLSHIRKREERVNLLNRFYSILKDDGVLVLSVPNSIRRFYFHQIRFLAERISGKNTVGEPGDIIYQRKLNKKTKKKDSFFYHLYTVDSLKNELISAGYIPEDIRSESIFPESWVVKSGFLSSIDRFISRILPVSLGYGIIVSAKKKIE